MARTITLKGNTKELEGNGFKVGEKLPDFTVTATDMSSKTPADYAGKTVILCTVPSLDTPVCDTETRKFNEEAGKLGDDVQVVVISIDTPMAQKRWCGAAGVENVTTLSDFKDHSFIKASGLRIAGLGLLARAIYVVDKDGVVRYEQLVPEVAQEPNYDEVLDQVRQAAGV